VIPPRIAWERGLQAQAERGFIREHETLMREPTHFAGLGGHRAGRPRYTEVDTREWRVTHRLTIGPALVVFLLGCLVGFALVDLLLAFGVRP
jgi:hypothetical protein